MGVFPTVAITGSLEEEEACWFTLHPPVAIRQANTARHVFLFIIKIYETNCNFNDF